MSVRVSRNFLQIVDVDPSPVSLPEASPGNDNHIRLPGDTEDKMPTKSSPKAEDEEVDMFADKLIDNMKDFLVSLSLSSKLKYVWTLAAAGSGSANWSADG